MGVLKSKIEIYEFSLEGMRELIAADLKVPVKNIHVQYVIDNVGGSLMDDGIEAVTLVRVTVSKTEEKVRDVYDR